MRKRERANHLPIPQRRKPQTTTPYPSSAASTRPRSPRNWARATGSARVCQRRATSTRRAATSRAMSGASPTTPISTRGGTRAETPKSLSTFIPCINPMGPGALLWEMRMSMSMLMRKFTPLLLSMVLRCGVGMGTTDVMARGEIRGERRRGRGREGGGDEEIEAIEWWW